MAELNPEERAAERRSMAERAVGGLGYLQERRPVEEEDLHRTLAGFLVARFFKMQRTGGFASAAFEEVDLQRARAWQGYLEDAEGGQDLPQILKDLNVLAELASSTRAFMDALRASPHVEPKAASSLRGAVEDDFPAALPGLLTSLSQAILGLP